MGDTVSESARGPTYKVTSKSFHTFTFTRETVRAVVVVIIGRV